MEKAENFIIPFESPQLPPPGSPGKDEIMPSRFFRAVLLLTLLLSHHGQAQEKYAWSRLDGAQRIEENGMVFAKIRDYSDGKGLMWYTEFRPDFSFVPYADNAGLYKGKISIKPSANFNSDRQAYLDFLNKHKVVDLKVNQLPGLSADGGFDAEKFQVCQLTDAVKGLLLTTDPSYAPQQVIPAYPILCSFVVFFFDEERVALSALMAENSANKVVRIRYSLPFCGEGSYASRPLDAYLQKLVETGGLTRQGNDYVQESAPVFFFRAVQALRDDPQILQLDGTTAEAKWIKFYETFVKLENNGKSVRLDLTSYPEREDCVPSPFVYSNEP
jgi:hypothetical protein